jgi:hypothetical protein
MLVLFGGNHAGDALVLLHVLCAAPASALCLRFGLTLRLASAPIVTILARYRGEHVEQHVVDGLEHPTGELITVCGPPENFSAPISIISAGSDRRDGTARLAGTAGSIKSTQSGINAPPATISANELKRCS